MSVGILHGTGSAAVARLAEKDVVVPERWRIVSDHSKRGLVAWVPIDIPLDEVLTWTVRASEALTRIPLTGRWRAAVHRRSDSPGERPDRAGDVRPDDRSEEHTPELQSLMRNPHAV